MSARSDRRDVQILTPDWPAPARVRAAFTLRQGGVSTAPYDSLNVGVHVGDDPAAVAENRRRIRAQLQLPEEPAWIEQVHGIEVLDLDQSAATGTADAVFTRRPGLVCAVQVADCLPVLFATRDGRGVGAAHAGWRGLAGGVLEATVAALREATRAAPGDIVAWLGACIGPDAFEVGEDVREAFDADETRHFRAAPARDGRRKWFADLPALAHGRLQRLGLVDIEACGLCTASDTSRFFSYRREGLTGRLAAAAWIDAV